MAQPPPGISFRSLESTPRSAPGHKAHCWRSRRRRGARYGRPVNVSSSSRGESWSYVIDGFDGTAFIPFYGGVHDALRKRHGGVIFFDGNGRVKDFNWNEVWQWAEMGAAGGFA